MNLNYSDPDFNVSLCYDKLNDNETHSFLHYENGNYSNTYLKQKNDVESVHRLQHV